MEIVSVHTVGEQLVSDTSDKSGALFISQESGGKKKRKKRKRKGLSAHLFVEFLKNNNIFTLIFIVSSILVASFVAAYFLEVGINEGLYTCMVSDPNGPCKADWGGAYDVITNAGLVVFGRNLVNLDAYTCKLIGKHPERVPYLKLGAETFGKWNKQLIKSTSSELRVNYQGPLRNKIPLRC